MDICIGNLPKDVTARDLREMFEVFGRVETADVVRPRPGEESEGLGFVGMPAREEAVSAVLGVHGKTVKGQAITANEVQPRGPFRGPAVRAAPVAAKTLRPTTLTTSEPNSTDKGQAMTRAREDEYRAARSRTLSGFSCGLAICTTA